MSETAAIDEFLAQTLRAVLSQSAGPWTANTQLQGGDRLDFSVGINYLFDNGHRLALEYSEPLDQDLRGPQLETDSVLTLGWQKAF